MKKSTLLSFATAGAVIMTSAATYAAWDQMSATSTAGTVTIDKSVTMSVEAPSFTSTPKTTLSSNVADAAETATVKVDVKDVPTEAAAGYELKTTATAVVSGTSTDASDKVDVTTTPDTSALAGGATDEKSITVTVTPKDESAAGQSYDVQVKAELVAKTGA